MAGQRRLEELPWSEPEREPSSGLERAPWWEKPGSDWQHFGYFRGLAPGLPPLHFGGLLLTPPAWPGLGRPVQSRLRHLPRERVA